jgi:hypothetical protein
LPGLLTQISMPLTKCGRCTPGSNKQDSQPGQEYAMNPQPEYIRKGYKAAGKLDGKIALITGGDSGIGRSISVHYAREGADIAIVYLDEDRDAANTRKMVEAEGKRCLLIHTAPAGRYT